MKKLLLLLSCCFALCQNSLFAATQINTPTVSGVWTLQGSPYYIHNNVVVPPNNLLTIQPGVEVIFMGNYLLNVQGQISAVGNPEQKIVFKANDTTGWSNNALPETGGWRGLQVLNYISADPSTPMFAYCIFRDIKYSYMLNGGLNLHAPYLYIDRCEFFHNNTASLISLSYNYNRQQGNGKLKFTNCDIHDNRTGKLMTTTYDDSTYIIKNKFYNNTSTYNYVTGIYTRYSLNDTCTDVLIFKENELYNNTVSASGCVVTCDPGGISYVEQNKIHHNQTELRAAVLIQSKSATLDRNLIANNSEIMSDGIVCGINDGGGAIQLQGQLMNGIDIPGQNEYLVRNNIIANNYSSITGPGIWAVGCKATIINNTIVNNTVKNNLPMGSSAIRGLGGFPSKYKIINNIISNNQHNNAPRSDSAYGNFSFYASELVIANNLIDYYPHHITFGNAGCPIQGLNTNVYSPSLSLVAPPAGAGPGYSALNANFGLTASATNCINKGSNTPTGYGAVDYNGQTRIFDQLIDIGAIEYQKKLVDTSTAIKGIDISTRIQLYPNPSTGSVQLDYDHKQFALQSIAIYTLTGQLAYQLPVYYGVKNLDVSMLADGVYMMQLITDKQELAVKKLIIHK
ncbi:T9SS type A sorting domain-containing protein [Taibaiella sp. KBW10]|uniref:T9SS type A sorting domain-containing protein n=1 Tax=Taibaiella sp. KBW10 TaxID=2153357 RepID=UPI0013154832|nr:T9SS type A sorting domain-containing protein [Taibaiella sp. KBW10]